MTPTVRGPPRDPPTATRRLPVSHVLCRSAYLSLKLQKHGFAGLAGRTTARLTLAGDVPAPTFATLTGTSTDSAARWAGHARRDWAEYIAARKQA